jgi:hypothetical protein
VLYQRRLKNRKGTYVPGGRRYSYIRARLSRREASCIVTGRELFVVDVVVVSKVAYERFIPPPGFVVH